MDGWIWMCKHTYVGIKTAPIWLIFQDHEYCNTQPAFRGLDEGLKKAFCQISTASTVHTSHGASLQTVLNQGIYPPIYLFIIAVYEISVQTHDYFIFNNALFKIFPFNFFKPKSIYLFSNILLCLINYSSYFLIDLSINLGCDTSNGITSKLPAAASSLFSQLPTATNAPNFGVGNGGQAIAAASQQIRSFSISAEETVVAYHSVSVSGHCGPSGIKCFRKYK